ncbi:MAG: GSCFA domain-containing protein [Rikenellaceae bacterium]|nr:GSCFA domain-containing protein [Rikenellaceae bacterium]
MQFRTPINITPSSWRITHRSGGFAVGSCFAEHISDRLAQLKYHITSNPLGPMYNPHSIARCIERISSGQAFVHEELCEWRGRWFSTEAHTLLAADTAEKALKRLNAALATAHQALTSADYVILTLGTNRVYEQNGRVVANCHRLPAEQFTRRSMGVEEITSVLSEVFERELAGKRIILTVSPIRHLKDGLSENALSKASLRVAAAELAARHAERVSYFPAYEIMMDDLRDYRFYAADMVHPSEQAVNYVWELFGESHLDPSEHELNRRIERLVKACGHRPLDASGAEYHTFLERTAEECRTLATTYPEVDFGREMDFLRDSLTKK